MQPVVLWVMDYHRGVLTPVAHDPGQPDIRDDPIATGPWDAPPETYGQPPVPFWQPPADGAVNLLPPEYKPAIPLGPLVRRYLYDGLGRLMRLEQPADPGSLLVRTEDYF